MKDELKIKILIFLSVVIILSYIIYRAIKNDKGVSIRISSNPKIDSSQFKRIYPPIFEDVKTCRDYAESYYEASDYTNKVVRSTAVRWAGKEAGEFNIGQICLLYEELIKLWNYVNDPNSSEYVSKASETIQNEFSGDCDDFAITISSLIMAIGGETRINIVFDDVSGHAFTEVNVGKNIKDIVSYLKKRYKDSYGNINFNFWKDNEEGIYWLNLDWFGGQNKIRVGGKYKSFNKGVQIYVSKRYCTYVVNKNLVVF